MSEPTLNPPTIGELKEALQFYKEHGHIETRYLVFLVTWLIDDYIKILNENECLKKANDLLQKGMKSQCELMDDLKQKARRAEDLARELGALYRLLEFRAEDPGRCPRHPRGERCALKVNHPGQCK